MFGVALLWLLLSFVVPPLRERHHGVGQPLTYHYHLGNGKFLVVLEKRSVPFEKVQYSWHSGLDGSGLEDPSHGCQSGRTAYHEITLSPGSKHVAVAWHGTVAGVLEEVAVDTMPQLRDKLPNRIRLRPHHPPADPVGQS